MKREIKIAIGLAVIAVAAVIGASGAQSFGHMRDWALLNGEPRWRALLFPVSVDGMMVAASVVLYVDGRLNRPVHKLAYVLLGGGVLVSVSANILHDWQHVAAEKWISAWGPLALFGSFELFVQFIRSIASLQPAPADPELEVEPSRVPWRIRLIKAAEPITPAVSTDPAVLAYAEPVRRDVVTERIPDPEPERKLPLRAQIAVEVARRKPRFLLELAELDSHQHDGYDAPIGPELPPAPAKPKARPLGNPRTSTAARSRRTITERSGGGGGQAAARAAWDSAPAGAKPSGADLARIAGVDRRTGARWANKWASNA